MVTWIRLGMLLMLVAVLVGVGLDRAWRRDGGRERAGPVQWPREEGADAPEAKAWSGHQRGGELPEAEDSGEILGEEGNLVWVPRLGLKGPWRDRERPLLRAHGTPKPPATNPPDTFDLWLTCQA